MADFDLLEGVEQKFLGTVVLYDKKAAYVKHVTLNEEDISKFLLHLTIPNARGLKVIDPNDPLLNYKNYQIGYVNGGNYASWWYRKPHKQWSQGLKSNQMGYKISAHGGHAHDNFGWSGPFNKMLEGIYPHVEECKKALIDQKSMAMAFHKDFAISYDAIHDDFVIEYHGVKIGACVDRELKQFKIMPEARHLIEALQEARSVYG